MLQARRTVPYAFNPALNSFGDGMGVPIFMRPDCPPEDSASTSAAPKSQKMSKVGVQNARPQFRSALEQVWLITACINIVGTMFFMVPLHPVLWLKE